MVNPNEHARYQNAFKADPLNLVETKQLSLSSVRTVNCEQFHDAWYLVAGIAGILDSAIDARTKSNEQEVVRALHGVNQYFMDAGIVTKMLVPVTMFREEAQRYVKEIPRQSELVERKYEKLREQYGKRFPDLNYLFITIQLTANKVQPMRSNIPIIIATPETRNHRNHQSLLDRYIDLVGYTCIVPDPDSSLIQPSQIIQKLQGMSETPVPTFPDPFTRKCGGVSLRDLVEMPVDENFSMRALQFIKSAPKGDYLWQRIVQHLFFPHPTYRTFVDEELFKEYPDFADNCLELQFRLFNNVMYPMIDPEKRDRKFDRSLNQVLSSMDTLMALEFMQYVYYTGERIPSALHQLMVDYKSIRETLDKTVYREIIDGVPAMGPSLVRTFFLEHQDMVRSSLVERFSSVPFFSMLRDGFDYLMKDILSNYPTNTEPQRAAMEKHLGEPLQPLITNPHTIEACKEELVKYPYARDEEDGWLESAVPLEGIFAKLGINSIAFHTGVKNGGYVMFETSGGQIGFTLDHDNSVKATTLTHISEYADFTRFFTMLAEAACQHISTLPVPVEDRVSTDESYNKAPTEQTPSTKLTVEEAHDLLESLLKKED